MTSSSVKIHKMITNRVLQINSYQKSDNSLISEDSDFKIQNILEDEEKYLIIYSIREELMQKVMEECYSKYVEKQSIKFTVHCAYRALVQLVNIGLLHHDPGKAFCVGSLECAGDKPPQPSPPDPLVSRKMPIKEKLILLPTPDDSKQTLEEPVIANTFDNFTVNRTDDVQKLEDPSDVTILYQSIDLNPMYDDYESVPNLVAPYGSEETLIEEQECVKSNEGLEETTESIFTATTWIPHEKLPTRRISIGKQQKEKKSDDKAGKKTLLSHYSVQAPSVLSVGHMPPLRADANCDKLELPGIKGRKQKKDTK